ncbi:PQQ-dependent sugar dehydrogenase [Paenibacillus bouchesdurhonensis]|uniref:PQQ-dependent sugar dehydrogenase n=1 Tax=Paenibacillus bouchesdurhonensis TaxID=1870990 RepID=UPI000DA5F6E7|nr:PQQ-dependent sugar dehydrogenase [Paenibacillus bouchesdurhonensis]
MQRVMLLGLLLSLLLSSCGSSKSTVVPEEGITSGIEENRDYEVAASRLNSPWAMEFSGESTYVSERDGYIVKINGSETTRQTVNLNRPVSQLSESGFLGFVLSPDFKNSNLAYAYHSYQEAGAMMNRIVKLEERDGEWHEIEALLEGIPGNIVHDGGRLAFGPDGMLYATTGDAGQGELAQDLNSLAGKILRLTPTGAVPEDNPFPDSYVYSYGHRNPQGLGWDQTGRMFSVEHGPSGEPGGHDELNLIEPGGNYGWPNMIGDETEEGMKPPLYHTGDNTLAPSGMAIDEEGYIIVAGLAGEKLVRLTPEGEKAEVLLEGEGRIRDVRFYNGRLYVITNNTDGRGTPREEDDRLLKLKY